MFAKARELGLEGIVSKRAASFYRCDRSRNWLKAKNPNFVRT
jgi:ATP-dependent DNA ligase